MSNMDQQQFFSTSCKAQLDKRNIKMHSLHGLSLFMLFCLLLSAGIPLTTKVYEFRVFTPYVVFIWIGMFSFFTWLMRPQKVIWRREEVVFVVIPILIAITSAVGVDPSESLMTSSVMFYAVMVFLAIKYCLRIRLLKRQDLFFLAFIFFTLFTLLAIIQYLLQEPFGIIARYFGENISEGSFWRGREQLRVSGSFTSANVFAVVYGIYGTVLVSGLLWKEDKPRIYYALIITFILLFVTSLSLSRSGMLFAIVSQLAIYVFWIKRSSDKKYKMNLVIVVFVVCFLVISLLIMVDRVFIHGAERFTSMTFQRRVETYLGSLRLLQYPRVALLGMGSGQFFEGSAEYGIYYTSYTWRDPSLIFSSVHNWPLQIATENGLGILFLYVYTIVKTFRRGWSIKDLPNGWFAASLCITVAVLYMTALQFDNSGTTPWILTPVAVLFAWIQNEYDEVRKFYLNGNS